MATSAQHPALLAGSTGLVGSHILTTLLAHPSTSPVSAFTRKPLPAAISDPHSRLQPIVSSDTSTWATTAFPTSPPPAIFLSALGTTLRRAGGVEAQRKVDYDLNLELAKKALAEGARVYVLISSTGADAKSMFPYTKLKGELEDAVRALGFDKVIVLRPGLIVGEREKTDSRPGEFVARKVAATVGRFSNGLKDFWAQDAEVIARAAVHAGLLALEGGPKVPEGKYWLLPQSEVVRLGRTEWDAKWNAE